MREVGIHLDDQFGAARECVLEAGDVGASEPVLGGAVQHLDDIELLGELVGEPAGAVG